MSERIPDELQQGGEELAEVIGFVRQELGAATTTITDEADYARQMRAQVSMRLEPRSARRRAVAWVRWGYAAAAGLLLAAGVGGGVVAGRIWERHQQPQITAAKASPAKQNQHVVVVVLEEHLDRSEQLLVELKHADGDRAEMGVIREEAVSLLKVNGERRNQAEAVGDRELSAALGQLETVLQAVAGEPATVREGELERLGRRLNAEGLLFDLRVLEAHRQAETQKGDRL